MKTIGCMVNTFLRPSEGFIYEQIINTREYAVEVLARDRQSQAQFPYDRVNTLSGLSRYSYTLFRDTSAFEKTVKEKDMRLIHAHFGVEGSYALPLQRRCRLPLIVTFHGQDITRLPKLTPYPVSWLNYWLHFDELKRHGTLFLAVSDYIKRRLIEKGFPAERVRTHYLGIDPRVNSGGVREPKTILAVSRLVEKKGIEYLIRAVEIASRADASVKLLICGHGPLRASLERLTCSLSIGKNVIFLGWQTKEQIYAHMRTAGVFVLPSVTAADGDCEGLGMVLLEAMAHGMPVIGTDHGGIPDVVKHGVNGFLVPEKNAPDLAAALLNILHDPALGSEFGRAGVKIVNEQFNIFDQVKKLQHIYKDYI